MDSRISRPSSGRRLLAFAALLLLGVLLLLVAAAFRREPAPLLGGVLGLALAAAGGWWVITERGARRWIGAVGVLAGLVLGAASAIAGFAGVDRWLVRLLVAIGLLLASLGAARAALVRDLPALRGTGPGPVRPKHPVLICNPKSGGGKVEKFGLIQRAKDLGAEVVLLEPGTDLEQLAEDAVARGADCLAMAGGDGSQALVAAVAIRHDVPFVCISAGTRNHFALDLGLDRDDPRRGLVALRDGFERRVDYATVGDRLFVNNVSLGIYATIVQEESYRDAKVETSLSRLPELLGRQAEPFDLQFTKPDGADVDDTFMILVSNNPYVLGPSFDVSQRHALDTGRLGVVAVTAKTGAEAARLVTSAALGLGKVDPNIHQFETTSFEVRSRSGHALAGVDGESLDLPTPLRFDIHPAGLRLLVPEENLVAAERRRARSVSLGALLDIASGRPPRISSESPQ